MSEKEDGDPLIRSPDNLEKMISLSHKDWGDPFRKLQENVDKYIREEGKESLNFSVKDCSRLYEYLTGIWQRLRTDFKQYYIFWSTMNKYLGSRKENVTPEPQDMLTINRWYQNNIYLELDYESFFIYARILMDKLANVTRSFFRGPSPQSFNKHKKYFFKEEYIPFDPDERYAKYIREKTDWFERTLKLPRDELIVHSLPFVRGIKTSSNGVITLPRMGWGRDLKGVGRELNSLKKKYEKRYPELKSVQDNIYEITKFFLNRPDIVLEKEDRTILSKCVRIAGSELSDISDLADKIIEFVNFFCHHFAEQVTYGSPDSFPML